MFLNDIFFAESLFSGRHLNLRFLLLLALSRRLQSKDSLFLLDAYSVQLSCLPPPVRV